VITVAHASPTLFDGLAPEQAARVAALGRRVHLTSGAVLFALGAPAEHLFVVERGRVILTLPIEIAGREEDVLVEERLPGEILGWSALIPPHRFTLKATAPLDTQVLAFSRTTLLEHFGQHPGVCCTVLRNLAIVLGQRLLVFQTMWLREMQRTVELRS
jgi:CRP-like cAMP-binding protein